MRKNIDRIIKESVDRVLAEAVAGGGADNGNRRTWVGIYNVLKNTMSEMNGMYSKKGGNMSVDDLTYILRKINSGLKAVPRPTNNDGKLYPYRIERDKLQMGGKYFADNAQQGPYGGQAPTA